MIFFPNMIRRLIKAAKAVIVLEQLTRYIARKFFVRDLLIPT